MIPLPPPASVIVVSIGPLVTHQELAVRSARRENILALAARDLATEIDRRVMEGLLPNEYSEAVAEESARPNIFTQPQAGADYDSTPGRTRAGPTRAARPVAAVEPRDRYRVP